LGGRVSLLVGLVAVTVATLIGTVLGALAGYYRTADFIVMRVVDITWTIGPVFRHDGSSLHWLDFALVLGIGCVWLPLFWRNLASRPLVPAHDPHFKEAMANGGN